MTKSHQNQEEVIRSFRAKLKLFSSRALRVAPLIILLVSLTISFFYGWYFDHSKPVDGIGWSDQNTYTLTAGRIWAWTGLTAGDLHFSLGYPLLGAIGNFFSPGEPFLFVSLALLILSAIFCFLAAKQLFGRVWALVFCALLFYWDGRAADFHFASELFAVPWNNQVLFFAFAYFLWLLTTQWKKHPTPKLLTATALVGGVSVVTREESILFVAPAIALYLLSSNQNWRKWLIVFLVATLCYMPQLIVKYDTIGAIGETGHDYGYSETLSMYFSPSRLYENTRGAIINSSYGQEGIKPTRKALLQVAPWLWVAPIGIVLIFLKKRYGVGLKIFAGISIFLLIFYLSGANISTQKLAYHCLRYIAPGFIVLNLATVVIAQELSLAIHKIYNHLLGARL